MRIGYTRSEAFSRPSIDPLDDLEQGALTEWALAAGIDLLEEDDVIVKNGYVVPKVIVPGTVYCTSNRVREVALVRRSTSGYEQTHYLDGESNKVVAYLGDKPLRVNGLFYCLDAHHYFYFTHHPFRDQQACIAIADTDRTFGIGETSEQRYSIIRQTYKPAEWSDIPLNSRRKLRDMALELHRNTAPYRLIENLAANARVVRRTGVDTRLSYKDMFIYSDSYVIYRDTCREFAELVRQRIAGIDPITQTDAVVLIETMPSSLQDRMIAGWNAATGDDMIRGACGHIFMRNEGYTTVDGLVCGDCFDENYRLCDDTDEYRHQNNCYYHEDDDCYRTYPPASDDDYDAGEDFDNTGLLHGWSASCAHLAHDKSFTPSSGGDFTMGIELEVEASGKRNSALTDCNEHFNKGMLYAMFKRDGSLSDSDGFEIVTAARRLNDHLTKFKEWEPEDLESWDTGCCGMHVHIDSRAFTPLSLGKFLMFYNQDSNMGFIRGIAGRHPDSDSGAASYAKKIGAAGTVSPSKVKRAGENNSRYTMVNVTNLTQYEQDRLGVNINRDSKGSYSTIEVRIFRGTLRKERLLAQIEFAHASVIFCRTASWQELDGDAFKFWLSKTSGYPHLRKWFGVFPSRNKQLTTAANEEDSTVEI